MGKNADTVRKSYRLFNQGKFDEALELYDDKVVYEVPGSTIGGYYRGKKQLSKFFSTIQTKFNEGLEFRVDNVIESKNKVIAERRAIVKLGDGKKMEWRSADLYE